MVLVLENPVLLSYSLQLTPGQNLLRRTMQLMLYNYFDFAKVFDSVPHKRLLVKLESYGIFGNLLGWLRSFLFSRRQRLLLIGNLHVGATWSVMYHKGQYWGLIYVNDIASQVNSNILQFADDLKMFRFIHDAADFYQLQEEIDKLVA